MILHWEGSRSTWAPGCMARNDAMYRGTVLGLPTPLSCDPLKKQKHPSACSPGLSSYFEGNCNQEPTLRIALIRSRISYRQKPLKRVVKKSD